MSHDLDAENTATSKMKTDYSDSKLDKGKELNDTMSISESGKDEYESTLHNLGGQNNG